MGFFKACASFIEGVGNIPKECARHMHNKIEASAIVTKVKTERKVLRVRSETLDDGVAFAKKLEKLTDAERKILRDATSPTFKW